MYTPFTEVEKATITGAAKDGLPETTLDRASPVQALEDADARKQWMHLAMEMVCLSERVKAF